MFHKIICGIIPSNNKKYLFMGRDNFIQKMWIANENSLRIINYSNILNMGASAKLTDLFLQKKYGWPLKTLAWPKHNFSSQKACFEENTNVLHIHSCLWTMYGSKLFTEVFPKTKQKKNLEMLKRTLSQFLFMLHVLFFRELNFELCYGQVF